MSRPVGYKHSIKTRAKIKAAYLDNKNRNSHKKRILRNGKTFNIKHVSLPTITFGKGIDLE